MLRKRSITDGETIQGKHADIVIIQVYMPTTDHTEEDIEEVYEIIEELVERKTTDKGYAVIMSDWHAVHAWSGKKEKTALMSRRTGYTK